MNDRFQNALQRKEQRIPPIWFMRQAGRYHQHYQSLRKQHSFMELCKNPKLAAEVALGPIEDFDFDVSILFSDLLFPLEALGMGLEYGDKGPQLSFSLNKENFNKLGTVESAIPHLLFQKEAMIETRRRLPKEKSLIGFVGGAWTLFSYAVQGRHDGSLTEAKSKLSLFHEFSSIMVPLLKKNIELQFEGGAEVVMVFDTAAGELSPQLFQEHVVPTLESLAQKFPGKLGYYSKATQKTYLDSPLFKDGHFAGLGFDHHWKLSEQFNAFPRAFIQGNFDQALLFGETKYFEKHLNQYLKPILELAPSERRGWVSGLGHGVLPHTPEEHVRLFVKTVRDVFR